MEERILRVVRSRASAAAGGVLVLMLVGYLAAGWNIAGRIEAGALRVDHSPNELRLEVVAVVAVADGRDLVTLRAAGACEDNVCRRGVWGLEWEGGHATIGPIARPPVATAEEWLRLTEGAIREITGTIAVGVPARLENLVYFDGPLRSRGIESEEVTYGSPLGDFPAWFVEGSDRLDGADGAEDTWVIYVHGKGSRREEALRILPAAYALGFPSLIITYRNDAGTHEDPGGRYQYGATEWRDLEAAVRHALAAGAEDVVLYGYSMGGAIVFNFLYESPLAGAVRGVILDAPMLDFSATVRLGVEQEVPGVLASLSMWIFGRRYGVDWDALDYLSRVDQLAVPVLLFHGTADDVVPFETSEALAAARPELVQFEPFAGAHHVGSWNVDPRLYEALVREFLERVGR